VRDTELLGILGIGKETSLRGSGISLREALTRTRYKELRASFGPKDLLPLIMARRTLSEEWIAYAGDKRTNGGTSRTRVRSDGSQLTNRGCASTHWRRPLRSTLCENWTFGLAWARPANNPAAVDGTPRRR
jgi:hypothetical protein